MWFVQQVSSEKGEKQDKRIHDQLNSIIKGRGKGWLGVNPGIAATLKGVEVLLKRIDDIFLQVPPAEPTSTGETQDFKGQKRKADNSYVVVLE